MLRIGTTSSLIMRIVAPGDGYGRASVRPPAPGPYPRADHPLMFQLSQHRLRAPMGTVLQPPKMLSFKSSAEPKVDRFGSAPVAHKTLAVSRRLRCEDKKPDRYWSAPLACEKASARETIISEEIAPPGVRGLRSARCHFDDLCCCSSRAKRLKSHNFGEPERISPVISTLSRKRHLRVRVLSAQASQSGLHRPTCEGPSKPRGTAAFRGYRLVSVSGIGLKNVPFQAPGLRGRFLVSRFCWTAGPGTGSPSSWARPPRTKEKLMKPFDLDSRPPAHHA